jgi:hypothetical protein
LIRQDCLAILLTLLLLPGCSVLEDTTYLTPIAQETLSAYRGNGPLTNKLQAVIAARRELQATRLEYIGDPIVRSVEEIRWDEAQKRVQQPGSTSYDNPPGDTKVWFIVFDGLGRINPPDPEHKITPHAPGRMCAYVMIEAEAGGRSQIGSMDCPP